jgi:hypothetical protein
MGIGARPPSCGPDQAAAGFLQSGVELSTPFDAAH